ncbi:hypothetical protein [Caldimonas brevitalea]|uniref:Uncharacterized protein n=1 Tax=Caldimonas brevitalea TaxID=413882 RepID=A0A0G3BPC9_9BURK|nr:hypothetical protein [Caldimonas brevitalea]AKJ29818.1 hypothetical protein AAW51_3127 [Caldimonas brevitalea]
MLLFSLYRWFRRASAGQRWAAAGAIFMLFVAAGASDRPADAVWVPVAQLPAVQTVVLSTALP